jgi:hypothetical protein
MNSASFGVRFKMEAQDLAAKSKGGAVKKR